MLLSTTGCLQDGCGESQHGNETIAYVKHVTNETPIYCPNRTDAELDLRTPGTMTSETLRFTVPNEKDAEILRQANVTQVKVKVISKELRVPFCGWEDRVTAVELLGDVTPTAPVAKEVFGADGKKIGTLGPNGEFVPEGK